MPYICSNCGAPASNDSGDGTEVQLLCGCDRLGEWIDDGRGGGYWSNPTGAKPVESPYVSEAEEWDEWLRRRR